MRQLRAKVQGKRKKILQDVVRQKWRVEGEEKKQVHLRRKNNLEKRRERTAAPFQPGRCKPLQSVWIRLEGDKTFDKNGYPRAWRRQLHRSEAFDIEARLGRQLAAERRANVKIFSIFGDNMNRKPARAAATTWLKRVL